MLPLFISKFPKVLQLLSVLELVSIKRYKLTSDHELRYLLKHCRLVIKIIDYNLVSKLFMSSSFQ